jgi:hypothetical protein
MQTLEIYTVLAGLYWRSYLRDTDISGPPILVDMLHDNLEYVATALATAASIRTATGRPLIGLTGPAGVMGTAAARPFDTEAIEDLARAFCVDHLIDVHAAILATPKTGDWLDPLRAMATLGENGQRFTPEHTDLVTAFRDSDGFPVGRFVMDTTLRASLTPHLRYGDEYLKWVEYLGQARDWAQGFFAYPFTIFAVGHSDYCPHGFLAEFGLSRGVSALLWTCRERSAFLVNSLEPGQTLVGACRSANARAFADQKAHEIATEAYPAGESSALARLVAEGNIIVARAGLMGRLSHLEDRIVDIRAQLFGGDPRPIVCLFAHTYSDVPCQDEALYRDHHEWLEATLAVAAESEDFNLLVKVHPLDAHYDSTGLTNSLTEAFADRANIAFCRAPIENEVIARDCALGITVRGTPGFLMPALGLRMVLAGRSVFSDAGMAETPETREQYLDLLRNVAQLPPLSADEIDNAERFLAFHLLTGSPRHALVPLVRADGRDSPFFAHAAELLRSWVPENCDFTRDLARLWSPVTGFQGGPANIRIGGRLAAPQREDTMLQASAPESEEPEPIAPEADAPKPGVIGWLARKLATKPTEMVELYKSEP